VLSFQQANEFLGAAHLQGNCPSSLRLGLMFEDKLVACMTFGKARFTKSFDFELLRYASALGVNVVGGAGKLFSHFRKLFPESSVISYSDRRWNTGQLYPKIGFTYSHSSTPNYFYSRDKVHLLSRHLFQKHKLKNKLPIFDPKLSEVANMYANGYIRTWDCGNDVFVFRPTV
jgi:hypothetical protein